ncbi:MAG: PD-(D/E)XK nuclease superfamily protein [Bacteroidetes bacterium ADurb.BinA104]|nr:MAG: PD-(D/E)XK nuclease superfamily protein [Bacteroidetes bacterium ADurb.BinA104]
MADEIILRNTTMAYVMSCERKFYYAVQRNLTPRKKAEPLDTGLLAHEGLKVFHHPINASKPVNERLRLARASVQALAKETEDEHDTDFDPSVSDNLIIGYASEYAQDPLNFIAVEQPVSYEMAPGIIFRGTIDGVARNSMGKLIMVEHKTIRALNSNTIAYYSRSPQTLGYASLMERVFKEEPDSILFNFLIKQKVPKYRREPAIFHRVYMEQWRRWAELVGKRIQNCISTGVYMENRYSCHPFAGRECPYIPLCWYGESAMTLALFKQGTLGSGSNEVTAAPAA